jgi:thymidylate synthase (FAD)
MHSVEYVHSTPDGDNLVAYMARVSNPSNQHNKDTAPRLIKYLIKHKHWSPFEMVSMCIKINTTRSIASQLLRHRSFSFQEFSQRYAQVIDKPQVPQLRRQDTTNRQNSIDDLDDYDRQDFEIKIQQVYDLQYNLYNEMLAAGVAKECARDVLPLSSPTTIYMHGNLRSWLHYCDLRCANGTQSEHKQIADQVKMMIGVYFPQCYAGNWDTTG